MRNCIGRKLLLSALVIGGFAVACAECLAAKPAMESGDETLSRMLRLRTRIRGFELRSRSEGGKLVVEGFGGALGSGHIMASGLLDGTNPDGPQHMKLELRDVDVQQFLSAFDIQPLAHVRIGATGAMDFRWEGLKMKALRSTLNGPLDIDIGKGTISHTRILDQLAESTGISELKQLDVESGRVHGEAKEGTIRLEEVTLKGAQLKVTLKGSINAATEQLNAAVSVSAAPDLGAKSQREDVRAAFALLSSADALRDSDGFVKIPLEFVLGGTLSRPQSGGELKADTRATTHSRKK